MLQLDYLDYFDVYINTIDLIEYPLPMDTWIASPDYEFTFDFYSDYAYEYFGVELEHTIGKLHGP